MHNNQMTATYSETEPARGEIDALAGPVLLEFGSPRCGHCAAAQPLIAAALAGHPTVRHFMVADGPGRPLGRSFRVKLWPTLIFLFDGKESSRLVRPTDGAAIACSLAESDGSNL